VTTSKRLRDQLVGLVAAPLAHPAVTARLGEDEDEEWVTVLEAWLKQTVALSPSFRYSKPKRQADGELRIDARSSPRGKVLFYLAGQAEILERASELHMDVLAEHDDDVVMLMLCADVTIDEVASAVDACIDSVEENRDERLVLMEPGWVAALLIERAKPMCPGDLDRAGHLPPTVYFDVAGDVGSRGIGFKIRRSDPEPAISAVTDTGLGGDRLERVQKLELVDGPIYLCTTFLPSVSHSQAAVQRFYRHKGATGTTLRQLATRHRVEHDAWGRHIADHRRIDVIDRGQLEEYFAAPEYYRMPLTPAELDEQVRNLEALLAHDNYVLCLTPEAVDIPFEIREDEVRVRADRRNKGQPRQGRIANLAFRDPAIRSEFEREFWATFSQVEDRFLDKDKIVKWLRERTRQFKRAEGRRRARQSDFDVFLCHNSQDKPAVKRLAKRIETEGLRPWFDEWHAPPGTDWLWELEKQIANVRSAAVFIGQNGLGPWQREEIGAFLLQYSRRRCPIFPVLLRGGDEPYEMPLFLEGKTWVDLRKRDGFRNLVAAVAATRGT
jgi:TIR domain